MDDEISIIKGKSPDRSRLLKPWGSHLESRLKESSEATPDISKVTSNDNQKSPDLDKIFDEGIPKIKKTSTIEKIIGITLVLIVSFYFILIVNTFFENVESIKNKTEVKKSLVTMKKAQTQENDITNEFLPLETVEIIEDKIANIDFEKDTYISNSLTDYELSLDYVDALLHCDYLEFSGSVLSFKSSYKISLSCMKGDSTRYSVSENQYIRSRDNLRIAGYVYNGNIVLSHHDNVLFAEKMGYENLINYESRNEIQKDYISWLSKLLLALNYTSE